LHHLRIFICHILLIPNDRVFGRELTCSYSTYSDAFWPTSNSCQLNSADLSESFKAQDHTFSGTIAQKLTTTTVRFKSASSIDFLPTELLSEFPHLNGMLFVSCNTLTTLKNGFFTRNFSALEYLNFYGSNIHTIEVNAFQHLVKLKWIRLHSNKIQSLAFQIFKNNPEMVYIDLRSNKINSIDSNFFKNLKKLKWIHFTSNLCVSKDFGCSSSTCSISQSELDSGLASCHSNCLKDLECSLKSGKFDKFSSDYIKENIDTIVSYGHLDVLVGKNFTDALVKKGYLSLLVENGFLDLLVAQNYLDLLIQNGHLDLLIEKNFTDLLVEKGYKNQIIESDWRLKFNWNETNNSIKNLEETVEENSNEIKVNEKKFEEISAMFGSDLKVQQDKVETLEKTIANLKENLKGCEGQVNFVDQSNQTVEEVEKRSSKITKNPVKTQFELAQDNAISLLLEKTKEDVKEMNKMLMLQVSEAKLLMENERLKFINDKQAIDFELKTLKQELVIMKLDSERREAAWKNEIKALKVQLNRFEMSSRP
jgi:hypothetical protein